MTSKRFTPCPSDMNLSSAGRSWTNTTLGIAPSSDVQSLAGANGNDLHVDALGLREQGQQIGRTGLDCSVEVVEATLIERSCANANVDQNRIAAMAAILLMGRPPPMSGVPNYPCKNDVEPRRSGATGLSWLIKD